MFGPASNKIYPLYPCFGPASQRKEQCRSCSQIRAEPRGKNHLEHGKVSGIKQFDWQFDCYGAAN